MSSKETVVITGGNRGIGKTTAIAFAQKGYNVVISSRDVSKAEEVVKEVEAAGAEILVVKTDVGKEEDVKNLINEAVKKFGKIDVMVNNAGIGGYVSNNSIGDMPTEDFLDMMNVDVTGVFWGMKYAIQEMLKTGGGSIVNNSSVFGQIGRPGIAHYVAAKHAVNGLTKTAALEYATKGIRVNAVAPGPTDTDIFDDIKAKTPDFDKVLGEFCPMSKLGDPKVIANAIVYLAAKENSFLTGSILVVDGGVTSQ